MKMTQNRLRCSVGAFALFVTVANAETRSERYSWLETDSPKRQEFISNHNTAWAQRISKRADHGKIGKYILSQLSTETVRAELSFDGGKKTIQLVDRGFARATEVVLLAGGKTKVLFSNAEFKKDVDRGILKISLSPEKAKLLVLFSVAGSRDDTQGVVIDLRTLVRSEPPFKASHEDVLWLSEDRLVFYRDDSEDGAYRLFVYDVTKKIETYMGEGYTIHESDRVTLYALESKVIVLDKKNQNQISIPSSLAAKKVLASDDDSVLLKMGSGDAPGEVKRFEWKAGASQTGKKILAGSVERPLKEVEVDGKTLFVQTRDGTKRLLSVYDFDGKMRGEFEVPECCSVSKFKETASADIIDMKIESAVQPSSQISYDLTKKSWSKDVLLERLLARQIQFKTEVLFIKSVDQTPVPVRITLRDDLKPSGTAPVLLRSYGGFGANGYVDPAFEPVSVEFLARGGILADPILRGGGEFGAAWHQAATKEKKPRTFEDLFSVADGLVQLGWTQPRLITSTGGSNGGLTVMATALKYPEAFGLVIPLAGVQDLLGKDDLDARFGGWSYEYGSPKDPGERAFLETFSPLENAHLKGNVRYLILEGLNDTRVNPAHSFKLAAALEEDPLSKGRVDLISLRSAGHHVPRSFMGSVRTWRYHLALWTSIFEQAGWSW